MIIDTIELQSLTRPLSTERRMAEALIEEAEREDIRKRIGDALFLRVEDYCNGKNVTRTLEDGSPRKADGGDAVRVQSEGQSTEAQAMEDLLNGCRWTDGCGELRVHYGLKRATAFYTYARILRDGSIQATRYGTVIKTDDHSRSSDAAERRRQYGEVFAQADGYIADILDFLSCNCEKYPEFRHRALRANRNTIRIIGQ